MAEPVLMPQVGQDIKTATIIDWLKKENDQVAKGEIIATVESDKAAFDIEAFTAGVLLKILHEAGEDVEVLTPIAYIGRPGEKIEREEGPSEVDPPGARGGTHSASRPAAVPPGSQRLAASPSARRLARENGLRIESVVGTGPAGRVVRRDVEAALRERPGSAGGAPPNDTVIAFSPIRMRIASRLTHSHQTIPHFYLSMDVDMSEAVSRIPQLCRTSGARVTVTDMIVKAVATALPDYPRMNAHVERDRILLKAAVNVGVAVAVEDGLIVPVVADANRKSLAEISAASRENAAAARAGHLKPQAVGGFTVTNLGMHGVDTFVPVINPPEAAILAVGTVVRKPAVVGDRILARDLMTTTLACDHRAVDGVYAAQFLGQVRQLLENPASLGG